MDHPNLSDSDRPRTLRCPEEVQRRRSLLREPHVAPLTAFVERLKETHPDKEVPWFDPEEAGVEARILLLLEAPARRGARRSGFVSANNDSQTAANRWRFLRDAGVGRRKEVVTWNIIPWYIGDDKRNRAASEDDIEEAHSALIDLLKLLRNLRVVVLMGKKAQSGWKSLSTIPPNLRIICAPHPSGSNVNSRPSVGDDIRLALMEAHRLTALPIRA